MIQLTPHMRILVAVEPADFRKGIDGLARVCKEVLKQDPFRGWVFVFRNRRATAVKVLAYDGQGFWLCQKRLSRGRFRWWPASRTLDREESVKGRTGAVRTLEAHQLQVLLSAGNPDGVQAAPAWRSVSPAV
jgi:transposase